MRALIVDDEDDMRVLVRAVIARADQGLRVACEATDGEEAVLRWRECRPDVIVLDERMPRMTGLEAAEQILTEDPTQPIILFSAFLDDSVRAHAARLGVRSCLSKDDLDQLPRALWSIAA